MQVDNKIQKTENTLSVFGFSDPEGIRTLDLRLRRALLYPAELPDQIQFNEFCHCYSFSNKWLTMITELLKLSCKSSSFFGKIQQFY